MSNPYDDIINLPRHVSKTRPQMPPINRAAQFTPFAALTGYDEAVKETARQTNKRRELGESIIADLEMKLHLLSDLAKERHEIDVAITYFQPDEKKEGGSYVTAAGKVKRVDEYEHVVVLMDRKKIPFQDISDIKCPLFKE